MRAERMSCHHEVRTQAWKLWAGLGPAESVSGGAGLPMGEVDHGHIGAAGRLDFSWLWLCGDCSVSSRRADVDGGRTGVCSDVRAAMTPHKMEARDRSTPKPATTAFRAIPPPGNSIYPAGSKVGGASIDGDGAVFALGACLGPRWQRLASSLSVNG